MSKYDYCLNAAEFLLTYTSGVFTRSWGSNLLSAGLDMGDGLRIRIVYGVLYMIWAVYRGLYMEL